MESGKAELTPVYEAIQERKCNCLSLGRDLQEVGEGSKFCKCLRKYYMDDLQKFAELIIIKDLSHS